eukprot:SAG31_NODE_5465_length_2523_cov_1.574670_2_plen_194_part_00
MRAAMVLDREMLQSILSINPETLQDDDGAPTDEQLIEMLARDEKEIELYEEVDRQSSMPSLIKTQDELPKWVSEGEAAEQEEDESEDDEPTGRGARRRVAVSYNEMVQDAELDKLLRSESDSDEDADHCSEAIRQREKVLAGEGDVTLEDPKAKTGASPKSAHQNDAMESVHSPESSDAGVRKTAAADGDLTR